MNTNHHLPSQNVVEPWIELNVVFVDVVIKVLCTQDFGNPYELKQDSVHVRQQGAAAPYRRQGYLTQHWSLSRSHQPKMDSKQKLSPDHSCHVRGRTALSGRSCWPTCSRDSTCLNCSHTSGDKNWLQHNLYKNRVEVRWNEVRWKSFFRLLFVSSDSHLIVHQQFRSFEVSRRHPDVVLLTGVIELC